LPESQVISWISQVCDALTYLHKQNPPIIHRDIKPANIKITPQGVAMLVDFGIAKIFDSNLRTTAGARAVTPGYSPLEQYGMGKTDPRTDIYALGATLYTLLTGQVPVESIQRMLIDQLIPAEQVNPNISPRVAEAIRQAMQSDPADRQASAMAFKATLQTPTVVMPSDNAQRVNTPETLPLMGPPKKAIASQTKPSRKWLPWAGLAAVVVICIVFVGTGYVVGLFDELLGLVTPTPVPRQTSQQVVATPLPARDDNNLVPTAIPPAPGKEADCESEDVFCVGLVTASGTVFDEGYNQSTWEGLLRAEAELGAVVNYLETQNGQGYVENINIFAEKAYDVIVTVGFSMNAATLNAASDYFYINFIGVDQLPETMMGNLTGIQFPEDKGGFLAGALASAMTKTGIVAVVLGSEQVPPVIRYKEGYEAGARYVNPDVQVIANYHPGDMTVAFNDPDWGSEIAKQALNEGADVIFGCGGTTGDGALLMTASMEGRYCIGVDTDQWLSFPEARPCLISSAMKQITPAVFNLIKSSKDGVFRGGIYYGDFVLAPFHDFDNQIPVDVKELLANLKAGLNNGSISTGVTP
jgi:basic membrane protein A